MKQFFYKRAIYNYSKTKLDSSFPSWQFIIKGYSTPLRLGRNQNGGVLLLYLREDIPCKILNACTSEKPIKNVFVEINLRSRFNLRPASINRLLLSLRHIFRIPNPEVSNTEITNTLITMSLGMN